jgi:hypothetical protein
MVSLRPSDAVEGGSLLDEADVFVKESKFVAYDFNGRSDKDRACLLWLLEDADGKEHPQYWSFGDIDRFAPSEDGDTLVAVGSAKQLTNSTNGVFMLTSVINAGFPEDRVTGSAGVFAGLYCHMRRVPQPKREGLAPQAGARELTVLVVDKIHNLPWEESKRGEVSSAPASASAPAAPNGGSAPASDEAKIRATEWVMELLSKGPTEKPTVSTKAFAAFMKDDDRNNVVRYASGPAIDDLVAAGVAKVDGETVSLV